MAVKGIELIPLRGLMAQDDHTTIIQMPRTIFCHKDLSAQWGEHRCARLCEHIDSQMHRAPVACFPRSFAKRRFGINQARLVVIAQPNAAIGLKFLTDTRRFFQRHVKRILRPC